MKVVELIGSIKTEKIPFKIYKELKAEAYAKGCLGGTEDGFRYLFQHEYFQKGVEDNGALHG